MVHYVDELFKHCAQYHESDPALSNSSDWWQVLYYVSELSHQSKVVAQSVDDFCMLEIVLLNHACVAGNSLVGSSGAA